MNHLSISKVSRRQFGASACGGYLSSLLPALGEEAPIEGPWSGPAVVAKVYLASKAVRWPKVGFDTAKEAAAIDSRLTALEKKHAGSIRFTGGTTIHEQAEIESWAKGLGDVDAVLMVPLCAPGIPITPVIDAARVPVLCLSHPYLGHAWSGVAGLRKGGRRVDLLPTSNDQDVEAYVPVFRAIRHLRRSKVVVATDRPNFWYVAPAKDFTEHLGTDIKFMKMSDLNPIYEDADVKEAKQQADQFVRGALRVVEPSRKEIDDAMRFYVGLRAFMQKEKINAISIDCFPAVVEKKLPSYPCIAWCKLNDQGLYGVCQADVRATMTQLLVTSYSGVPGFVANPVFDAGRNLVIYSHCVGATRMLGFHAPASRYLVRSHLETAEGAVLQVVMPTARTVTVGQFSDAKRFLVSTAQAIGTTSEPSGSPDADYGCRTKVITRVPDALRWAENYETGVHRVVFYGDYVKGIERVGRMMGFEVVKEG
jgi:hypothetical protein